MRREPTSATRGGIWQDFWRGLVDLVYPPPIFCAVCGREAIGAELSLCRDCLRRLPIIAPPICDRCGRLLRLCATAGGTCRECARESFFFMRARAVCLYDGPVRAYLHEVKFRRSLPLALALAGVLASYAREQRIFREAELLVPVPLDPIKQAERGFNQAAVLAEAVGKVLRRPVMGKALARTRQTETQSRLDRDRRRQNVHGAFRVSVPAVVAGRRILLIDDILTTGFTASECARILLRAGAAEVTVLTFANGILEEIWLGPQTNI